MVPVMVGLTVFLLKNTEGKRTILFIKGIELLPSHLHVTDSFYEGFRLMGQGDTSKFQEGEHLTHLYLIATLHSSLCKQL